ncbi:hypothetical protein CAI21_19850 [Alkalilimnicola ehrlichii]|uniref:Glycosyltransferase n=1 Tax=Alkalilimnicola ehrlichii TaxID=351052 RepID=A0A3E0WGT8_9GAMM|nr:glycosyltransferase [Alkalilimnicola ehrlichii]RFA25150.1 hypothetical protein CAI21_19850 [Alkalilimnicola ehrlichii]RFA32104.1 hypothetical protein CAL65_20430 [Alkalilimnicola ehrlichii]
MRIAQFIDTMNQGGAEHVVLDLAQALGIEGHEVVVLHFGSPYLKQQCRLLGLTERVVPGHRFYKKTATLPQFAWLFQQYLRHEGIQVLHSHLFGPITGAAPAARMAGIPHIGTLHDVYSITDKPPRIRLLQLASLLGTRLVAVSHDMEQFYRSRARFSPQALRTVYNGVAFPSVRGDRQQLRQNLGLPPHAPVIITVGRLVSLKRQSLLFEAFGQLDDRLEGHFLVVGDGPERERLERMRRTLPQGERIHLLGTRSDVASLLKAADIFCLGSDTEGLSCSVLEAMAAGLPAVVTNVGGNRELVHDDYNGF